MPIPIVADVTSLIDLANTDQCHKLFCAEWDVITSVDVISELTDEQQVIFGEYEEMGSLRIVEMESSWMASIDERAIRCLADHEAQVIALSLAMNCAVTTRDAQLKSCLEAHGIRVVLA